MLTTIYKKVRSGYVAWVEEIPGVNTQGATKAEAKANLADALREFVAARRMLTKRESARGESLVRESIPAFR
ncbi:MAG: hypothetical protein G01um10148_1040 [Parcubacteria group bacterium Gr01-1014_8]|nr:MAG: hypothetical protein G01um10148_1040 [Parcubacteria group bacterium Gr01-1014_8]